MGISEGHACHARRMGMDYQTLRGGPDKQVPPSGRDKRVPPWPEAHVYRAPGSASEFTTPGAIARRVGPVLDAIAEKRDCPRNRGLPLLW